MIPNTLPAEFQDEIVQIVSELATGGYIRLVLEYPGQIDPQRLSTALRCLLDTDPVLGCRFEVIKKQAQWRRRDDIDSLAECPLLACTDVEQAIDQQLAERFDPWNSPNIKACIIRPDNGSGDCLLIKLSHVVADGAASLDTAMALSRLYSKLGEQADYHPPLNSNTRDSFLWLQSFKTRDKLRLLWDDLKTLPQARKPVRGLISTPERYLAAIEKVSPTYKTLRLQGQRTATLDRYARERRVTLNDIYLSAFMRAFDEFCPAPHDAGLTVVMPTNLRTLAPLQKPPAIRNLGGITHIRIGADIGTDFDDTLAKVRAATLGQKRRLLGTEGQIMTRLLARASFDRKRNLIRKQMLKGAARPAAPVLTNIGAVRANRLSLDTLQPQRIRWLGETSPMPVFLTTVVRLNDKLEFSVCFDRNGLDPGRVDAFLACLDQALPKQSEASSTSRIGDHNDTQ